jgi:hypothetical protein
MPRLKHFLRYWSFLYMQGERLLMYKNKRNTLERDPRSVLRYVNEGFSSSFRWSG